MRFSGVPRGREEEISNNQRLGDFIAPKIAKMLL